ncbi:MAG: hypothetical protein J0I07_41830 [Myxococcales bacterium]|nr:hypothetical protein [Myxococcales bacterium]
MGLALADIDIASRSGSASSDAPVGHYTLTTNTALDTRTKLRWMRGYAPGGSSGSQTCRRARRRADAPRDGSARAAVACSVHGCGLRF